MEDAEPGDADYEHDLGDFQWGSTPFYDELKQRVIDYFDAKNGAAGDGTDGADSADGDVASDATGGADGAVGDSVGNSGEMESKAERIQRRAAYKATLAKWVWQGFMCVGTSLCLWGFTRGDWLAMLLLPWCYWWG